MLSQKEINRQLRNIRRRELYLTKSILACPDCNVVVINMKHPVILRQKNQDRPSLCVRHVKMIDRFNHRSGSD